MVGDNKIMNIAKIFKASAEYGLEKGDTRNLTEF